MIGFGGAFLRVDDPEGLYRWYEQHLGLQRTHGSFVFEPAVQRGPVVLALFARDDGTFPPEQAVMLNLQVDDVDGLLDRLVAAGVEVDPKRESYEFGRFGWFTDPAGNRVEVWQPAPEG